MKTTTKSEGEGQDHISALPDSIIQYIFSFLTVEEFIKTCVLSKRWRDVWAAVPTLNFSRTYYRYSPKLASFINKTLSHYTACKIEKFIACSRYCKSLSSQVDEWIAFAAKRHVEELSLTLYDVNDDFKGECYHLAQCIYACSSLRMLNTEHCNFQPIGHVSWPKLKVLSIGYVKLSNEIIAEILSGSPMLEFLNLQYCHGITQLIVNSLNLKELVIEGILWGNLSPTVMNIWAPNIHSISLIGYNFGRRKYKLIDMSSAMEANLSFELIDTYKNCHMLKGLLQRLCHVQKLTIGPSSLKILSKYENQYPILCKLTSLTIKSSVNKMELPAIASLLESSPELEKLTINMTPSYHNSEVDGSGEEFWTSKERLYKCLSCHLKIVEITGLQPEFPELKFHCALIEFLLNNAKVLENMDIRVKSNYFRGSGDSSGIERKMKDFLDVNRLFLRYPRASPKAVVLLENPFH